MILFFYSPFPLAIRQGSDCKVHAFGVFVPRECLHSGFLRKECCKVHAEEVRFGSVLPKDSIQGGLLLRECLEG